MDSITLKKSITAKDSKTLNEPADSVTVRTNRTIRAVKTISSQAVDIAGLALEGMLCELSCSPSPGLVSRFSSGAHRDMDYFTFLTSASALLRPLSACAEAGFSPSAPAVIFSRLREIGRQGEEGMFRKTAGVNTHKGMLFLLGICCAAAGKALYDGAEFSSLPGIIREMTQGLVDRELRSKDREFRAAREDSLSHGEKLFLKFNIEGIRGEVERGLPVVFEHALGFYQAEKQQAKQAMQDRQGLQGQGLQENDLLIQTLLVIMQNCEDSTILHRHSFSTLKEVQARAAYILALGGVKTPEGCRAISEMDRDFSERRISPGGSADLLGVTVFFDRFANYMRSAITEFC